MSMLALPETECQEILFLFRQHLPHVPDTWLQELAGNYGLDAVVDIDPNDVIAILSVPGELHRIQVPQSAHEPPEEMYRRMLDELAHRGIKADRIISSFLTIQDSPATLAQLNGLVGKVVTNCVTNEKRGWASYVQNPNLANTVLTLFFVI